MDAGISWAFRAMISLTKDEDDWKRIATPTQTEALGGYGEEVVSQRMLAM
ncbi:hypothetical protein PHLCEN_2v1016 [Hermanssonia centrifuga]|uniref:Uncharacterized protein n=1 Tax=Hermanssonia centrifuga TaxID=98765 RepID=A0A2R6S4G3_9APHY|nr:hypothetical protein PHLCEN_2v1016 [Hermanssonia centrifuga]